MKPLFADTFYFLALLNPREKRHAQAVQFSREPKLRLVTTEWVLVEFGDAYSDPKDRGDFNACYRAVLREPRIKVLPASSKLFRRGVDLFERRPDKHWSLTDCLSFIVIRDEGISDPLTGDRHFEQAGFRALLK